MKNLENVFKQNINLAELNVYPKYKLVDGGERVMIEVVKDKFKSFGVHHISEEGILCDDLKTYIKWEMFSWLLNTVKNAWGDA